MQTVANVHYIRYIYIHCAFMRYPCAYTRNTQYSQKKSNAWWKNIYSFTRTLFVGRLQNQVRFADLSRFNMCVCFRSERKLFATMMANRLGNHSHKSQRRCIKKKKVSVHRTLGHTTVPGHYKYSQLLSRSRLMFFCHTRYGTCKACKHQASGPSRKSSVIWECATAVFHTRYRYDWPGLFWHLLFFPKAQQKGSFKGRLLPYIMILIWCGIVGQLADHQPQVAEGC